MAFSPSTSTHQPSDPIPPSPPTAALKFFAAYPRISSSNVPGCSHTAGMPSSFASCSTFSVTFGGVMMETAVVVGMGNAERLGIAAWVAESAVIEGAVGLMGVTGRECSRYQAKTEDC